MAFIRSWDPDAPEVPDWRAMVSRRCSRRGPPLPFSRPHRRGGGGGRAMDGRARPRQRRLHGHHRRLTSACEPVGCVRRTSVGADRDLGDCRAVPRRPVRGPRGCRRGTSRRSRRRGRRPGRRTVRVETSRTGTRCGRCRSPSDSWWLVALTADREHAVVDRDRDVVVRVDSGHLAAEDERAVCRRRTAPCGTSRHRTACCGSSRASGGANSSGQWSNQSDRETAPPLTGVSRISAA